MKSIIELLSNNQYDETVSLIGELKIDVTPVIDFFYSNASKRIKKQYETISQQRKIRNEKRLTASEVYPPDPKLVIRILNQSRGKNNPYLIPNAVLEGYSEDKKYGILTILEFESVQDILWGDSNEINGYVNELFKLLWETIVETNMEVWRIAHLCLSEYVPYAKYTTYFDLLMNQHNLVPAVMFGVTEDYILENIDSAYWSAYSFLYQHCAEQFESDFLKFATETNSFSKIDKVFVTRFINAKFIPMLKDHIAQEPSFGLRVKNLILHDLSLVPVMITNNELSKSKRKMVKALISASSQYIVELEKIQSCM